MPYSRNYRFGRRPYTMRKQNGYYGRKAYRRRRYYKRRPNVRGRSNQVNTNPAQAFTKMTLKTAPQAVSGTDIGYVNGVVVPKLNEIPGYARLAGTYDMYRIKKATVCFRLKNNTMNGAVPFTFLPRCYTAPDTNGILNSTGTSPVADDLINKYDCRTSILDGTQFHKHLFYPKPQITLYQNATSSSYGVAYANTGRNIWIDTNEPACAHYGLFFYIDSISTGQVVEYEVDIDFEFKCIDLAKA